MRATWAAGCLDLAVVGHSQRGRRPGLDGVERALPRGEVDLGRSRRRIQEPARRDQTADGVPGVADPLRVQERHVVGGVAGSREDLHAGDRIAEDMDVGGGHRDDLAEEAIELVSVEATGASFEAARIDEMRRADLADVHLEARVAADERAGPAGVVRVDVRQEHRLELGQAKAAVSQAGLERVGADGRPAVDDRGHIPAEQVAADDVLAAQVEEIEELRHGVRTPPDERRRGSSRSSRSGRGCRPAPA